MEYGLGVEARVGARGCVRTCVDGEFENTRKMTIALCVGVSSLFTHLGSLEGVPLHERGA